MNDQAAAARLRGNEAQARRRRPERRAARITLVALRSSLAHRVLTIAAGVAFYAILSLFPAVVAFVSIYGLFANPATVADHIASLAGDLPYGAAEVVGQQMRSVAATASTTLSLTFAFGLLISLWSANSATVALFDALNVAYGATEKRSLPALYGTAFIFTLGLMVFSLAAIGGLVVLPAILAFLAPIGGWAQPALRAGPWIVLAGLAALGIAALYRFGPCRAEARWRWLSVGSAVATVLWIAGSVGLSYYASHFASYNRTYGSLGAIIGLMLWLWVSVVVILFGAELDGAVARDRADPTI